MFSIRAGEAKSCLFLAGLGEGSSLPGKYERAHRADGFHILYNYR